MRSVQSSSSRAEPCDGPIDRPPVNLRKDGDARLGVVRTPDDVPLDLAVLALGGDAQEILHSADERPVNLVLARQGELLVKHGEVRGGPGGRTDVEVKTFGEGEAEGGEGSGGARGVGLAGGGLEEGDHRAFDLALDWDVRYVERLIDDAYEQGESLPLDVGKVTDSCPDFARAGLLRSPKEFAPVSSGPTVMLTRRRSILHLRVQFPRYEP